MSELKPQKLNLPPEMSRLEIFPRGFKTCILMTCARVILQFISAGIPLFDKIQILIHRKCTILFSMILAFSCRKKKWWRVVFDFGPGKVCNRSVELGSPISDIIRMSEYYAICVCRFCTQKDGILCEQTNGVSPRSYSYCWSKNTLNRFNPLARYIAQLYLA